METPSIFSQVIQEHLELKRRNARLESEMPLSTYETEDPFANHPLFKSEQQARLEETLDGTGPAVAVAVPWPGEDELESAEDGHLWGRSRDFDWGD